jgi:hypothetical protein
LLGADFNKHFLNPNELTKGLLGEIEKSKKKIASHAKASKKDIYELLTHDKLRDRLESSFSENVGKFYCWEELQKAYEKAELRFRLGIPPGLRDQENKENYRKYGDAILWFQLIDHVRIQKKPLVFITDDSKDDWWKFDGAKQLCPRSELVQEMFIETNELLYMYKGYNFLEIGAKVFNLEAKPEVIEDAKEVSYQVEQDLVMQKSMDLYLGDGPSVTPSHSNELAVRKWLETNYPSPDFRVYALFSENPRIDFMVSNVDTFKNKQAESIEARVLIMEFPRLSLSRKAIIQRAIRSARSMASDYLVIFYDINENKARRFSQMIESLVSQTVDDESLNIPANLSIIVGFIENNNLSVVSMFPRQRN